ncbi:hypothetical protein M1N20_01980, partial [Dehalococcoidia bacterium]|nr:hypothetical protein [Dehalococcoidia bacterium]
MAYWWWGDLANARERDYGSLKELAERMGIDYSNLAKCASIASRYELLLRSKTLSFKHHQIAVATSG